MKNEIPLDIQAQPDDESCGPSCLYSLYRFYGDRGISLRRVTAEIERVDSGGTLAEILACHALRRGFRATIYTYHLQMFDPTWFAPDSGVHDPADITQRLSQQAAVKRNDRRLGLSTRAFTEFLGLGGVLKMADLTPSLIRAYLLRRIPIIAGLSSTFLYRSAREVAPSGERDDIGGEPQGHFVMLVGYDPAANEVLVADPLDPNPPFHTAKYRLSMERLINAVLLGILTYDANLLVIEPGERMTKKRRPAVGRAGRARKKKG